MTSLSVNVNKVATLRNTRHSGIPSVVKASRICLDAGAHGITVHPRPDERHIRPGDVADLAALLREYPDAEFNIEGNPFEGGYLDLVKAARPHQCTLVPDDPNAFTSNRGWDIATHAEKLRPVIATLKGLGCRVSLFVDADADRVVEAAEVGADRVELYTEPFALAFDQDEREAGIEPFQSAAKAARERGLGVHAGHDLNLENLPYLLTKIPEIAEVSIGHALMADALEMGLAETVRRYLAAIGDRHKG